MTAKNLPRRAKTIKICSFAGCSERYWAKDYCRKHYSRWLTYGTPVPAKKLAMPARFWAKVAVGKPWECWEWQARRNAAGYGTIKISEKNWLAHRFSFSLWNGELADGLMVLHSCDNRSCVNPNHLSLGTAQDNAADMVARNRQSKGQHRPGAKLSDKDVALIFELRKQGLTHREIAERFNMHQSQVSRTLAGKAYAHAHPHEIFQEAK